MSSTSFKGPLREPIKTEADYSVDILWFGCKKWCGGKERKKRKVLGQWGQQWEASECFSFCFFLLMFCRLFIFSIISVFHRPLCQQPLSPWKLQPAQRQRGGGAGLHLRVRRRLRGGEVRSGPAGPAGRRLGPRHPLRSWAGHPGRLHDHSRHSAAATDHRPHHHNAASSHPAAMATQTWAEVAGSAVGGRQGEINLSCGRA